MDIYLTRAEIFALISSLAIIMILDVLVFAMALFDDSERGTTWV